MKYTHKPIDLNQQLATLKKYGLLVNDEHRALEYLHSISYFRIACYLKYFEETEHHYACNTHFEDAINLYLFDNCLKNIISQTIRDIEIALRTRIIHYISMEQGAFWFMEPQHFENKSNFEYNLNKLSNELKRSNEDFLLEHFQKYDIPSMPPAWKSLEVATLGTLSKIYENLITTPSKKNVAHSFGLPQYTYLESWNRSITVLRNCCAHHTRVWNRRFSLKPQLPHTLPMPWISNTSSIKPYKLYAQLCVLAYIEQTIIHSSELKKNLLLLIHNYPNIDISAMGFPNDWQTEPLWK